MFWVYFVKYDSFTICEIFLKFQLRRRLCQIFLKIWSLYYNLNSFRMSYFYEPLREHLSVSCWMRVLSTQAFRLVHLGIPSCDTSSGQALFCGQHFILNEQQEWYKVYVTSSKVKLAQYPILIAVRFNILVGMMFIIFNLINHF